MYLFVHGRLSFTPIAGQNLPSFIFIVTVRYLLLVVICAFVMANNSERSSVQLLCTTKHALLFR